MTSAAPSTADVLETVDALGPPGTPVTTPEVAEGFDCTQRTIYNRLEALVEEGPLLTKKVGANSRVWWRPVDADLRRNGGQSVPGVPVSLRDGQSLPFTADGDMAERIREFDWTETSLGPIEEWPAELRTTVDIMLGADEAIGVYWGEDLILLYNDAAREQIGKKHPDALGRSAREVFPEAWETLEPMHEQVMAGEGAVRVDEQYLPLERGGNLEDIWFDSSFNPIPVADGSVGGVFNVSVEVTDRVQAEAELRKRKRESEERYRTVLKSMDEGFFLADVVFDRDGDPLDVLYRDSNPAATEMVGEAFEGRWLTEIDPGYEDHWFETFGRVANTGDGERSVLYAEPDGRWYDFYMFKPEDAGPRRVAAVFQDITERKEAEEAVRDSERRLRLATDIADIAVFEWDLETDRVSGNERMNELFGYDEHETIVGEELLDERIHPDDLESVTDQLEEVFEPASDGEYEFEFRARRPDGSERWVRTNGEVFFEGDGDDRRAVRVHGTGIDITERKEMEEDLRESEERQSYLVELNDALRSLTDPAAIQEEACRVLGEHLDVKRTQYGELDLDRAVIDITRDYYRGGQDVDELPSLVGTYHFDDFPAHAEAWLDRRSLIVNDAERDPALSESERTGMAQRAVRATLSTPLVKNGEPVVVMAVTSSVPREWTEADIALLEETADRTWEAVQRARAEQDLAAELDAMKRLQEVSTQAIQQDDDGAPLYESVLEASMDLVDAEFGTIQRLDPEAHELEMFAHLGFSGEMIAQWDRVDIETGSSCGRALQTEERVVVPDVQSCEFIDDGDDLEAFDRAGIRSVQTTPLVSRSGELLGMLSTHWTEPHEPSERDLHLMDVIARQVADLMQQRAAYEALEESEERYRTLFESIIEGFCTIEVLFDEDDEPVDYRFLQTNPAFEEQTGLVDAEGKRMKELEPDHEEHWFEIYGRIAKTGESERFTERAKHLDDRWFDVNAFRVGDPEERKVAIAFTDTSDAKQFQIALERLNEASRELIDSDPEEIKDRTADIVQSILDVEYAALWRYDETVGVIDEYASQTAPEADFDASRLGVDLSEAIWNTFINDDVDVDNDINGAETDPETVSLRSRVLVPLGRHGVIYAGSTRTEAFDEQTIDLVETVAATIETAWDRADSEQELARRNEELTRLDRLNTLIRELDQALVAADTREAIDEAVCEQLANSELYGSAWLATYDGETDTIRPQAWARIDSRYLDERTVTVGDGSSDDPLVVTHRTHEMQVVSDIAVDARAASWREAALERGARSAITVPIVHEESIYGILTVYGRTPQPDNRETAVLAELGDIIAHAIHAIEATTTRQTDSVVELTLRTKEANTPLARLSREANCEISVEGLIPSATDEALTVFFTANGVSPDALATASTEVLAIEDLACLDDRGDRRLYRAHLTEGHIGSLLDTRTAVVRSLSIERGTLTLIVDLPETEVVSEFLDDLRGRFPNLELLARTTRTRPLQTQYSLQMTLEDRLTARQLEVLQMAYESGFFESPRVQTGKDLSEALDISQSTFTYHLRESQRRLCEMVFEPA